MQVSQKRLRQPRRGAMLVLVAITLVIFIVALVFSIDVAYMQLVRSQLRAAADAAAKAGAQMLSTPAKRTGRHSKGHRRGCREHRRR